MSMQRVTHGGRLTGGRRRIAALALAMGLAGPAPASLAADVCVDSAAALQQSLIDYHLQPAGSTYRIRVVQGSYSAAGWGSVQVSNAAPVHLKVLGGYLPGCSVREPDARNTVIDGELSDAGLLLVINTQADLLIEALTVRRVVRQSSPVLMLMRHIGPANEGVHEIRNVRFIDNTAPRIVYTLTPVLRFVSNLVARNTSTGASTEIVTLTTPSSDGQLVVLHNTIAQNAGIGLALGTFGVSDRVSELSGNILWNNAVPDMRLAGFDAGAYPLHPTANLFGTADAYAPGPADLVGANPQFVNPSLGDFSLLATSPAINRGTQALPSGLAPRDVVGQPRVIGTQVDFGAFETGVDDFTVLQVTTATDNGNNTVPTPGSLRAALRTAAQTSTPVRIAFDIPGECPRLISLPAPLPDVVGTVLIDGWTQPGATRNTSLEHFDANVCVYLSGTAAAVPWALRTPNAAVNGSLQVRGIGLAGFSEAAVMLAGGSRHQVHGNHIGTVSLLPGNQRGIHVTGSAAGAYIGRPTDPGSVNLFPGNIDAAIRLENPAGGSLVAHALIGFDAAGGASDGGTGIWIQASPNNCLLSNTIGNGTTGVMINGANGNRLAGNRIGIRTLPAVNFMSGVTLQGGAGGNTVGWTARGSGGGNLIRFNGGAGVHVAATAGAGNRVRGNRMGNNAQIDIDLAAPGPTASAQPVPGTPNLSQPPPALTVSGASATHWHAIGTVTGAPATTYRVDLYVAATGCHAQHPTRGVASEPIGSLDVLTDAQGHATLDWQRPIAAGDPAPGRVSGTVTAPDGSTSEIGNCVLGDDVFHDGFE